MGGCSWHKETLWGEDLTEDALVVLAAEDHLVPARLVHRALTLSKSAARVLHHPTHGHGEFLIDGRWRATLVAAIRDLVNECSGAKKARRDWRREAVLQAPAAAC